MNTLSQILVFVMACCVSCKAGMAYGQIKIYRALTDLPEEETMRLLRIFRDKEQGKTAGERRGHIE